ncbi:hypothetical protein D3C74_347230 [compost metagenome]
MPAGASATFDRRAARTERTALNMRLPVPGASQIHRVQIGARHIDAGAERTQQLQRLLALIVNPNGSGDGRAVLKHAVAQRNDQPAVSVAQLQLQRLAFVLRLAIDGRQPFQLGLPFQDSISAVNQLGDPAAIAQTNLIRRAAEIAGAVLRILLRQPVQQKQRAFG